MIQTLRESSHDRIGSGEESANDENQILFWKKLKKANQLVDTQ
ncbi:hypothetical protein SORDD16_00163 [Streptococcus oralis]|uniref:Uncharacterized protein n=1 Tax=Streptococcus oralis TaxID=1303 RepID=A0A139PGH7_STROR|nr:hypothetical protein SORDD16_00163 [Streptococcus oralis]